MWRLKLWENCMLSLHHLGYLPITEKQTRKYIKVEDTVMLTITSAWLNTFWLWGQQYLVHYLQNCWPRGTRYSVSSYNSDSSINCTMESHVGKEVEEGNGFQSHSERERERATIRIYWVEQDAFPWGKHVEEHLGLTPVLDPETGYSSQTKPLTYDAVREKRPHLIAIC